MTVVYIDVLFLLNLVVDYLLLVMSAQIAGERIVRSSIALAAVFGALYAAAQFLPGLEWLGNVLCKISVAVVMGLISFGHGTRLLRQMLIFGAVSAALGGVVLAMQMLGAGGLTLENGVLYTGFNIRLLLVTIICSYVVLSLVFRRAARHGGNRRDLMRAKITIGDKTVSMTVLLDTGNTLTDPMNNRPVMVAEARALNPLLPKEIDPADPVGSVERLGENPLRRKIRLLPYRAVGIERGMLLAIQSDRAILGNTDVGRLLVAISPTLVSDGGAYQALIGEIDPVDPPGWNDSMRHSILKRKERMRT